jgi:hypothetical protein
MLSSLDWYIAIGDEHLCCSKSMVYINNPYHCVRPSTTKNPSRNAVHFKRVWWQTTFLATSYCPLVSSGQPYVLDVFIRLSTTHSLSLSLVWQFVWKQLEYPTLSRYQGNRWLSLVHRGSRKLCDMVVISCLVYIQKQIAIKLFEQFVQEEEERYQLNKVVWHLNHS